MLSLSSDFWLRDVSFTNQTSLSIENETRRKRKIAENWQIKYLCPFFVTDGM